MVSISIKTPKDGEIILSRETEDDSFLTWRELAVVFFDALKGLSYDVPNDVIDRVINER